MLMARPCERRVRTFFVCIAVTYALCSLLYMFLDRDPPTFLLLQNATWWKTRHPAYNMSLLEKSKDLQSLVDISDFKFLMNNKRCDDARSVFLAVFVHSAPYNFEKRQVIRNTWGNEENLSTEEAMRVVFLLGTANDSTIQQKIEEENYLHHDIIQGNFLDSYRNLTYKHIMGLKWVTYFCRQARFVFKSDDDIFVDVFQLASFLKTTFGTSSGVANLMMCYLIRSPSVKRSQRSKWRVSFKEYPGRRYPSYCAGWGILMSPDVVFRLYLRSSKIPFFWVDDVHVTGTLANQVGVIHLDFTEKLDFANLDMQKWLHGNNVMEPYIFGPPNSDMETITTMWNRTMQYYNNQPPAKR